jgi:ParB family chromosome partitioning protein
MTPSLPKFSNADQPPAPAPTKKTAPKAQKADGPSAAPNGAARTNGAAKTDVLGLPPRRGPRTRDVVDGKAEYKLVPIDDLHDDPDNPRKTYRNIMPLAASIKQEGLLEPVNARIDPDGKLIIMWGHRRIRAIRLLSQDADVGKDWQLVPTLIRYGVKDSSVLAKQLIENSHRDNLDPIEEARGIRAFMREHRLATYQQAAQQLGHSLAWVAGRVALLDLEQEDQEKVSEGKIPIMDAIAKARKHSGKTRVSKVQREGYELPHFSEEHFLAGRARSRCNAGRERGEAHKPIIGGVACGACWEVVIRLDARRNADVLAGSTH